MSSNESTVSLPSGLIVLLGGARCGKSSLAVELACQSNQDVYFIATAETRDEDMKQRITRHKAERPNWSTKSISQIATRISPTLVISNEVGLGIVLETNLGRKYRDLLGQINQLWMRAAKNSLFLVAGKAFSLKNPKELLV